VSTKRILRALRTFLRTLCVLDLGRHARLRKRDRSQIRSETRDANVMIAFCERSLGYVLIGGEKVNMCAYRDEAANP
jgi:hypothetical protein